MRRRGTVGATCAPSRALTTHAAVTDGHRDATVAPRLRDHPRDTQRGAGERIRERDGCRDDGAHDQDHSGGAGGVLDDAGRADHSRPVVDRG